MDIISKNPKEQKQLDKLLLNANNLKDADNDIISNVFELVSEEFESTLQSHMEDSSNQLDVLIDIITRDGNCIMSRE